MAKKRRGGQRRGHGQGCSDLRDMVKDGQKWSRAREVVRERTNGQMCQRQLEMRTAG